MSRKTRKLMWSAPLVAAFAVVGALAIFMTLTPYGASAQQQEVVPGAPTDLMLRALDQTTIELKWKAPTDDVGGVQDGYRIDYSGDGMVWHSLVSSQTATKYVDNLNLEASETRYYRVFAFNSAGTSRMLGPESETTTASTAPEAPTALVVNMGVATATEGHLDEETLVVTWTAPVDPPGAPVTTYRLQVSKNGSSFTDLLEEPLSAKESCTGRVCMYTHKALLESTERWYQVYAKNSVGESPASEIRSGETAAGVIPAVLAAPRASLNPAGRMGLYWDRPVPSAAPNDMGEYDPPGAPVIGYYIQGGPVSAGATGGSVAFVDRADGTTAVTDDPAVSEVYFIDASTDVPLTSSVLSTLAKYAGTPDLNGPDDDLGTEGDNTQWGFRVMAVNRVVQRKVADGTINSGASPDGHWSPIIRVNSAPNQENVRNKPTITADRHSNSDRGRTGIELVWKPGSSPNPSDPAPAAITYRVEVSEDRIDWTVLTATVGTLESVGTAGTATPGVAVLDTGTEGSGVHVGLHGGATRHYRVFAKQPNGSGSDDVFTEASALATEMTATPDRPDTPELGDVSAVDENELMMTVLVAESADTPSETPPTAGAESGDADVGFGELKGYRIEISDDGRDWTKYDPVMIGPKLDMVYSYSEKDQMVTVSDTGSTTDLVDFRHTGLSQKSTRYYRASTVNNAPGVLKYSVPTAAKKGTTHSSLTSDDPGGLVAKSNGHTMIDLVWNARAPDIKAAPVAGYKIDYSPLDDEDMCEEEWETLEANTGKDLVAGTDPPTSYTHMDLMPSTGYCYRVFGINAVGGSTGFIGFGDAYTTTYDNDAIAKTEAAMAPGMPMNVRAMNVRAMATSATAITVTWEAPANNGGADITGYMVERAYMMADETMSAWMAVDPAHSGTTMTYMDTGLMEMTKYYYRVSAMNSVGTGTASDGMASATTGASSTDLTRPMNVRATSDAAGTLTLTWEGGENADHYILIAVNMTNHDQGGPYPYDRSQVGGDVRTGNVTGLSPGAPYLGIVVAVKGSGADIETLHGTAGQVNVQ